MAFFGVASFLSAIASFLIFMSAKSAIHEILGVALGLVSAIFGVGSVIVSHLNDLPERIARGIAEEQQRATAPTVGEALRERSAMAMDGGTSLIPKIVGVLLFLFAGVVLYVWYNRP